jgi:hypothetical protein
MEHQANGSHVVPSTRHLEAALSRKRQKFIEDYCKKRNWDPKQLSFEQSLEIRKEDEWEDLI